MRKREQIIFHFITHRLGFLKNIPLAAWIIDAFLKINTQLFNPQISKVIDELESEISGWENVSLQQHKYGGIQFNFSGKELGHIHANGLVDVLLNLTEKSEILKVGLAEPHHVFKNSGWISFYIKHENDKENALMLFRKALHIRQSRKML